MNKKCSEEVGVVWKNSFHTLNSSFAFPKLKIFMREYQQLTAIQVWRKIFKKNEVWKAQNLYILRVLSIQIKYRWLYPILKYGRGS